MSNRDTITIRAKRAFVEEILDEIIKKEGERGGGNGGYPEATEILRLRIYRAGGLKDIWYWVTLGYRGL